MDSLSTIRNFAANKSHNRPNLFADTTDFLQKLNSHITHIWVPSRVGIPGNERVDWLTQKLALQSAYRETGPDRLLHSE